MKVYLLKDLPNNGGKAGTIVELSDGYARNFVLKGGFGRVADKAAHAHVKQASEAQAFHKAQDIKAIKEIIERLKQTTITLDLKVGANGKVFGAITGADIATKLAEKDFGIDKKALVFDKITGVGTYKIKVKFDHALTGEFNLVVGGK